MLAFKVSTETHPFLQSVIYTSIRTLSPESFFVQHIPNPLSSEKIVSTKMRNITLV